MASKVVVGEPIKTDTDYLRDDDKDISDFLEQGKTLAMSGPRRSGKTSFLFRLCRWGKERSKATCIYCSLDGGAEQLFADLSKGLGRSIANVGDLCKELPAQESQIVFALDECYTGIFLKRSDAEECANVLLTLWHAAQDGRIRVALADIPRFYSACRSEEMGLHDIGASALRYLRPITVHAKEQFLMDGPEGLFDLRDLVGFVPTEVQWLRYWYERKVPDGSSPVGESEVLREGSLAKELSEGVYDLMFGSLLDEEKSLLRIVCATDDRSLEEGQLNTVGKGALRTLGAAGYGMLRRDALSRVRVVSPLFQAYVAERHPIQERDYSSVLRSVQPGLVKKAEQARGTFYPEFIIHQIGDLHFGLWGSYARKEGQHQAYNYLDYLFEQSDRLPHLIVICGDLTSQGRMDEFIECQEFLQKLRTSKTKNGAPFLQPFYEGESPDFSKQILIVPGNHEASWGDLAIHDPEQDPMLNYQGSAVMNYANALSDLPSICYAPPGIEIVLLHSARHGGLKVCLGAEPKSPKLAQSHRKIEELVRKAYTELIQALQSIPEDADEQDKVYLLQNTIRFTCGYIEDADLRQIKTHLTRARSKPYPPGSCLQMTDKTTRIGVCHHNLSNFHDPEIFADMVNSGDVRDYLLDAGISILLHGHTHRSLVSTERIYRDRGWTEFHSIGVGTLGALTTQNVLSFNEITVQCQQPDDAAHRPSRKVSIQEIHLQGVGRIRAVSQRLDHVSELEIQPA